MSAPNDDFALMVVPENRKEQTACERALFGERPWPNTRRINRQEYDYWLYHCLPFGCSIVGVPGEWLAARNKGTQ